MIRLYRMNIMTRYLAKFLLGTTTEEMPKMIIIAFKAGEEMLLPNMKLLIAFVQKLTTRMVRNVITNVIVIQIQVCLSNGRMSFSNALYCFPIGIIITRLLNT